MQSPNPDNTTPFDPTPADDEETRKRVLKAEIWNLYGVHIPYTLVPGLTVNQLHDIKGILHDAKARAGQSAHSRVDPQHPLPGKPVPVTRPKLRSQEPGPLPPHRVSGPRTHT